MADVFLERTFDPAITVADVHAMAEAGAECFGLHRVGWHASLLSTDGRRMLCRFYAADAESVRIALRQLDADISTHWHGHVFDAAGSTEADQRTVNVVVERRFEKPLSRAEMQAAEDAAAWCREAHGVTYLGRYQAADGQRVICRYRAPDAESVRLVQRQADFPFENLWACTPVWPDLVE